MGLSINTDGIRLALEAARVPKKDWQEFVLRTTTYLTSAINALNKKSKSG
jgi:hypothetical protein